MLSIVSTEFQKMLCREKLPAHAPELPKHYDGGICG